MTLASKDCESLQSGRQRIHAGPRIVRTLELPHAQRAPLSGTSDYPHSNGDHRVRHCGNRNLEASSRALSYWNFVEGACTQRSLCNIAGLLHGQDVADFVGKAGVGAHDPVVLLWTADKAWGRFW